jgi:hypothetical protein
MGVQLSDLMADRREVVVSLKGLEFMVAYNPSAYTPELESMILNIDEKRPVGTTAELLESIVVDWDLIDGTEKVPVNHDSFVRMGIMVLAAILGAINADLRPKGTKPPRSDGGSLSRE